jgi:hypothetical protein
MNSERFSGSKTANPLSAALTDYINLMIEEVVLQGGSFEKNRKWLKKNCALASVDYTGLEQELEDFIAILLDFDPSKSQPFYRLVMAQAAHCHITEMTFERLVAKTREDRKSEQKRKDEELEKKQTEVQKLLREKDDALGRDEETIENLKKEIEQLKKNQEETERKSREDIQKERLKKSVDENKKLENEEEKRKEEDNAARRKLLEATAILNTLEAEKQNQEQFYKLQTIINRIFEEEFVGRLFDTEIKVISQHILSGKKDVLTTHCIKAHIDPVVFLANLTILLDNLYEFFHSKYSSRSELRGKIPKQMELCYITGATFDKLILNHPYIRYESYEEAHGYAIIAIDNRYGLLRASTGTVLIHLKYEHISFESVHKLFKVKLGGKWGYVNNRDQVVVPLIYDEMGGFFKGLSTVQMNGKSGYIDPKGVVVILLIYDHADDFHNEFLSIVYKGRVPIVLNREGKKNGILSFFLRLLFWIGFKIFRWSEVDKDE